MIKCRISIMHLKKHENLVTTIRFTKVQKYILRNLLNIQLLSIQTLYRGVS